MMKTFWLTIYRTVWKYILWLLALEIVVLSIVNGIGWWLGAPAPLELNTWILGAIIVIYGLTRITRFHPVFNKRYLRQLAVSPWDDSKALPDGPVELFWADGIVLAFFMVLTLLFPVYHWTVPLLFFLGAYNLTLLAALCTTGQAGFISIYVLGAPLIVYPHWNILYALLVLIGLTTVGTWAIRSYLNEFPWNTPWWNEDQVKVLKEHAFQRRVIQWPFRELRITDIFHGNISTGVLYSVLYFIYAHVINWVIFQTQNDRMTEIFFVMPVFFIPILRFIAYGIKYRPPINIFGRLITGRLIIPGYDIIFIGPIVALLTGLLSPYFLSSWGLPNYLAKEIGASLCIFTALACPPNFEKWHYTGHHRILKQPKPTRTINKNAFPFLSQW